MIDVYRCNTYEGALALIEARVREGQGVIKGEVFDDVNGELLARTWLPGFGPVGC